MEDSEYPLSPLFFGVSNRVTTTTISPSLMKSHRAWGFVEMAALLETYILCNTDYDNGLTRDLQ